MGKDYLSPCLNIQMQVIWSSVEAKSIKKGLPTNHLKRQLLQSIARGIKINKALSKTKNQSGSKKAFCLKNARKGVWTKFWRIQNLKTKILALARTFCSKHPQKMNCFVLKTKTNLVIITPNMTRCISQLAQTILNLMVTMMTTLTWAVLWKIKVRPNSTVFSLPKTCLYIKILLIPLSNQCILLSPFTAR